jgi:hypothetical protein
MLPPSRHPPPPPSHPQNRGEHKGKLGALQLLQPSPMGVVARIAMGVGKEHYRGMGGRESTYSGFDRGRGELVSYDDNDGTMHISAIPIVQRLMPVVRHGGAIGSPGTLRGQAVSLEALCGDDPNSMDAKFVRAVAAFQTLSGCIWVHEAAAWAQHGKQAKRLKR